MVIGVREVLTTYLALITYYGSDAQASMDSMGRRALAAASLAHTCLYVRCSYSTLHRRSISRAALRYGITIRNPTNPLGFTSATK